jgi:hypothetical protein
VTLNFHVADHGLDDGASSHLAFDDVEDATLLSRDEDAARVLGVITAVSSASTKVSITRTELLSLTLPHKGTFDTATPIPTEADA